MGKCNLISLAPLGPRLSPIPGFESGAFGIPSAPTSSPRTFGTLTPGESGLSTESLAPAIALRYNSTMIEIRQTDVFFQWLKSLKDRSARARVNVRIRRLSLGNPGDVRPVGEGVSELRIHYGPGYRVYFAQIGQTLVVLLAGGDKSTQDRDIETALKLAREL
jgi:putative addiction module killer protein